MAGPVHLYCIVKCGVIHLMHRGGGDIVRTTRLHRNCEILTSSMDIE